MARSLAIATLVSALITAPMWGQMRGGRRGGVSMGRPGFVSHGPVMANQGWCVSNGGAFIRRPQVAWRPGNFRRRFFVRDRFFVDRFHHRYRLWSYPFFSDVYPWYWYDADSAYYADYSYRMGPSSHAPAYDSANRYNAADPELASAIARLSDEVEQLRAERQSRDTLPAKPEAEKNSEQPESAVLVFHDKHTQAVQNYAIVGSTLWILNERRATKVPLSSLDIDRTIKLNDERGIEFRLPK